MSTWYAAFSIALTLTGCSDDPERSKRANSDPSIDLTEVDSGESSEACTNSFPVDPTPVSTDLEVSRPPPLEEGLPEQLSDTPLYEDIATGSIQAFLNPYWADRLGWQGAQNVPLLCWQNSPRGGLIRSRQQADAILVAGHCAMSLRGTAPR